MDRKESNEQENTSKESILGDTIIDIISHAVSIPLFIMLHRLLPDLDWKFNIDRILLFLIIIGIVEVIFYYLRKVVIIGFSIALIVLTYGSIWGNYGYVNLYKDYRSLIYSMLNSPFPENIVIQTLHPFPNKSKIVEAIDYNNPSVRNFAITATTKHFNDLNNDAEYRTDIQCFAVFKEINSKWNYVSDPKGEEYFAKASESIQHLSGDCDDHAILMAASIKALGGTVRLIHTTEHIYPELLIGDLRNLDDINYIIRVKLFEHECYRKSIHYHTDNEGKIWLNMDYTEKYPGGRFMKEEILHILPL